LKIDSRKKCEYAKIYCGKWDNRKAGILHRGRVPARISDG
jgi:hypothetical protein